ncbi:MAG: 30S ribosomal protein S1 [Schwartzia sp.]|nr:30S ribosomal protein S1 [Schwartzia sp. (in: firmicutes)]
MNEFESLLKAEEEAQQKIEEDDIVKATVVSVDNSTASVNIPGLKADIPIEKKELGVAEQDNVKDVFQVGDEIEVCVVKLGGEHGAVVSKVKADRRAAWKDFEGIVEREEIVPATVKQVVKGGIVAEVRGARAFIPASQVECHFVKDLSVYVGQTLDTLPLECDIKKQRLVLSRRKILEREQKEKQEALFGTLETGQTLHGTVKRLVDYGAFIDIGGVDGLAHISDLSWTRVKHPSDVLEVGQELDVYIKNFDPEKKRISLSIKETMPNPWDEKIENYHEGEIIRGRIIKLMEFGAFMEIEPGFDGLIPMGELSNTNIAKADEVVHVGDEVTVKILHIDKSRRRISLSLKRVKKDAEPVAASDDAAGTAEETGNE